MASPQVISTLQALESSSTSQGEKAPGYSSLLTSIVKDSRPDDLAHNLIAFVDSVLSDTVGIVTSRPLLASFVEVLKTLSNNHAKIQVGQHAVETLQPRVISFEEQDIAIREALADAYEADEQYLESAKVLQAMQLDTTQRMISDEYRFRIWMRIVRLFLEEDEPTNAETYLNRAKNQLYKVQDQEQKLIYQLSQARVLDARRKFLDASQAYHSFSFSTMLAEEERTRALSEAIKCAVLAPAGPQRSRTLAKLYKDERALQVEEFGILEKMFLDRLLAPSEVDKFAAGLAPHQLAQTADGSTVLAKAVVEHNLLGASKLYSNIGIDELGVLLGLDGEKAEEYAARMIEQGRVSGSIDQVDRLIRFEAIDNKAGRQLRIWDMNVQGLAEEVEKVTTLLRNKHPDFVTANLVH